MGCWYIGPHGVSEENIFCYKNRIMLSPSSSLNQRLISDYHDTPVGGHSGYEKTLQRLKKTGLLEGHKKQCLVLYQECDVFQRSDYENLHPAGLLQQPLPDQVREEISMDFVKGLPKSLGKSTILKEVGRLTKFAHFIPLYHSFTAKLVAASFTENVYKLYGLPRVIVSDGDNIFTGEFWKELWALQSSKLHFSKSSYPQTDGQTEVVNKCLKTYLRCFSSHKPQDWYRLLPWA